MKSKILILITILSFGGCMFFISEQESRKMRSIKILKKNSIPYINHLPVIEKEDNVLLKNKEEICDRAIALSLVAVHAEGIEGEILENSIMELKADDKFTPEEKEFLKLDSFDLATKAKFLWRYESLWVLLWSLGYVETLDLPTGICDVPFSVGTIIYRGREKFIKEAKLRSKKEILDQADLIYRIHWATTEARIKNQPMPADLDNSTVYERHYALNWLLNHQNQNWDDVSTDT